MAALKVLIGYPLYGRQVYAGFAHSLHRMKAPLGTDTLPQSGHTQGECRCALALLALQGGYSHLFMLDTDMTYPDDVLLSMLGDDNDVECGFAVSRHPPHYPVFGEEGDERYTFLSQWPTDTGQRYGNPLIGPQPTAIVGGAALLIKTSVFPRIPFPWFAHSERLKDGSPVGEDAYFSQLCRDAGIPLYCRTDVLIGHTTEVTLLPEWTPDTKTVDGDEVGDGKGQWQIEPQGLGPFYQGPAPEVREQIRTTVAKRRAGEPTPASQEGD